MLSRMTHKQFDEWCAKDLVEPIGNNGTNEILIRLAMMIAMGLGHKEATASDFASWIETKQKPAEDSVAIAALEAIGARRS